MAVPRNAQVLPARRPPVIRLRDWLIIAFLTRRRKTRSSAATRPNNPKWLESRGGVRTAIVRFDLVPKPHRNYRRMLSPCT